MIRFCMVCGESISNSEHEINKIEKHPDGRFQATVLICKKCRDFHEKYLNGLTTLGYETDKSSQNEKQDSIFEISYCCGTTKEKKVIAYYSKGDKIFSDNEIPFIPIARDGYWKFILKKEITDTVASNNEKNSES